MPPPEEGVSLIIISTEQYAGVHVGQEGIVPAQWRIDRPGDVSWKKGTDIVVIHVLTCRDAGSIELCEQSLIDDYGVDV